MSRVTSGEVSFREMLVDSLSESATNALYPIKDEETIVPFAMGLLNSKVVSYILSLINPTLNVVPEDIRSLPILLERVEEAVAYVQNSISNSRSDWDSFETSWDFKRHPLVSEKIREE